MASSTGGSDEKFKTPGGLLARSSAAPAGHHAGGQPTPRSRHLGRRCHGLINPCGSGGWGGWRDFQMVKPVPRLLRRGFTKATVAVGTPVVVKAISRRTDRCEPMADITLPDGKIVRLIGNRRPYDQKKQEPKPMRIRFSIPGSFGRPAERASARRRRSCRVHRTVIPTARHLDQRHHHAAEALPRWP
jgi:hypothetical protein